MEESGATIDEDVSPSVDSDCFVDGGGSDGTSEVEEDDWCSDVATDEDGCEELETEGEGLDDKIDSAFGDSS